jgi:hypothetical protein
LGVTHVAGATLYIPQGTTIQGGGTIKDPIDCQGTIATYFQDTALVLNGGIKLGGEGWIQRVTITTNDDFSIMTGGNLYSKRHYIGNAGNGIFTQAGGKYIVDYDAYFYLGYTAGDSGEYRMQSGSLYILGRVYSYVGYNGTGAFSQSGGLVSFNESARQFVIAANPGSHGSYELSGGELTCRTVQAVGRQGIGRFGQSGGIHNSMWALTLGQMAGGEGTYDLSGTGQLFADYLCLGDGGTGTFNQFGGVNTVSGDLYLVLWQSLSFG